MKSYGQFCPVAKAAELFCERWTALILRDLAAGSTRYSELRRGVPLMSPTLLSRRLRQLEQEGVIERRPVPNRKGSTYHMTDAGRGLIPLVEALGVWGRRWTRRELAEHEIDLNLLLWTLERSVDASVFSREPALLQLEFTDQPANKRNWWLLNEGSRCQLCLSDPGFEVLLYLSGTLPDIIYIVRGDLPPAKALASGRLRVTGPTAERRRLAAWFNLGPVAKIASRRSQTARDRDDARHVGPRAPCPRREPAARTLPDR